MKIFNATKYLKTLPLIIILFSSTAQAKPDCWSAGILSGMCYQQSDQGLKTNKQDLKITRYSASRCWSAGAVDGMCVGESMSPEDRASSIEKTTEYSSQCWSAGILDGMCY